MSRSWVQLVSHRSRQSGQLSVCLFLLRKGVERPPSAPSPPSSLQVLALGQEPVIAAGAARFLRLATPALLLAGVFECLKR